MSGGLILGNGQVSNVPAPIVKKKEVSVGITREDIVQKYNEWLADTKHLDAVKALEIEWLGPGFIIEVFAPDFTEKSSLQGIAGLYLRISPYARILSCSPYNEGPRLDALKAGDVVYIGDVASNIKENIEWKRWAEAKEKTGTQKFETPEPIQWIRSVHAWVQQGKLFFPDKATYMADSDLVQMDQKRMNKYLGPFIFEVEAGVVMKKIKKPWG